MRSVFLVLNALFILAPALAGRIGVFLAVSYRGSHSRGWSEVSFSFVPGFVAKTQDPLLPCSSVYRLPCTGPTKRETIEMGDCYILCGWSGVTWTALLRIVSNASGSFFLLGVARRSYRRLLSPSGSRCPYHGYASSRLRNGLFVSLELGALVLSLHLFFEKNFAVIRVGGRVCWHLHTSLRCCYLGAFAPRFFASFHRACVVAVQALGLLGPARLDLYKC